MTNNGKLRESRELEAEHAQGCHILRKVAGLGEDRPRGTFLFSCREPSETLFHEMVHLCGLADGSPAFTDVMMACVGKPQ